MSRPRIPIGTFGEFTFQATKSGEVRARTYFRDWDGTKRLVQASGPAQAAVQNRSVTTGRAGPPSDPPVRDVR